MAMQNFSEGTGTTLGRIYQFLYQQQKTSKLEISTQLQLSRPTVTQALKELSDRKLIEKNGYFASTGGRKADALSIVSSARIAVGLELLAERYEIVAVDLYGVCLRAEQHPLPFSMQEDYFCKVCAAVQTFIGELAFPPERILGIGIVLQGLISSDGARVTYGKILGCTGLTIDRFTRYLPYSCRMIHDAEAAATAELWNTDIQNAIFFHIRNNLSGALIVDGCFLKGNELKSGVFEHMTIVTGGRPCYCGKCGCMETYCSMRALLSEDPDRGPPPTPEEADRFFCALRAGNAVAAARWDRYLHDLALAIDNLHMLIDYDVILGGHLAAYLQPEDLAALHRLVAARTAFPTDRQFIKRARCGTNPNAIGAALPFIREFLETVF